MSLKKPVAGEGGGSTNDGFFHPRWDHFAEWNPGGRTLVAYTDGHAKSEMARGRYDAVLFAGAPCWGQ